MILGMDIRDVFYCYKWWQLKESQWLLEVRRMMCMSKSKVDFITIIIQDVASALGKTRKSPWFWEIRNTKEGMIAT